MISRSFKETPRKSRWKTFKKNTQRIFTIRSHCEFSTIFWGGSEDPKLMGSTLGESHPKVRLPWFRGKKCVCVCVMSDTSNIPVIWRPKNRINTWFPLRVWWKSLWIMKTTFSVYKATLSVGTLVASQLFLAFARPSLETVTYEVSWARHIRKSWKVTKDSSPTQIKCFFPPL